MTTLLDTDIRNALADILDTAPAIDTTPPSDLQFVATEPTTSPTRRLAAAAAIVIVVAGLGWVSQRQTGEQPVTSEPMTSVDDDTTDAVLSGTHMLIDPPPRGQAKRIEHGPLDGSVRIYTEQRSDPENGPWMIVGWAPGSFGSSPTISDGSAPDRQFFDAGRGYVFSRGIDVAEVRRLIAGATTEPNGPVIDPTSLPEGLELTFDGDQVSDVGLRSAAGEVSEVSWWADSTNGPFVRLLVADDPDMAGWRAGRLQVDEGATSVTETTAAGHPAYLRSGAGVRVLSWHDGSRWLQLVASNATDEELMRYAGDVRQAEDAEWAGIANASIAGPTTDDEQATVGPEGSATTPIVDPTTIGSVTLADGTSLSISAAAQGIIVLSDAEGFVIHATSTGSTSAVGTPIRITSDMLEDATGDLVYGIVVAGATLVLRDDATGAEIPVAITTETKPVNGFVGFAARLPRSTTYGTLSITDPLTGMTSENNVGY